MAYSRSNKTKKCRQCQSVAHQKNGFYFSLCIDCYKKTETYKKFIYEHTQIGENLTIDVN